MNGPWLTERDRNAVVRGAVLVGGLFALARGLPWVRLVEREARDESLRAQLLVERLVVADIPSRSASLPSGVEPIRSHSVIEGTALFTNHVDGLARFAGVEVHSYAASGDTAFARGVATVVLRLNASASAPPLLAFLRELELGAHPVLVRSLLLRNGNPFSSTSDAVPLRVEAVLTTVLGVADPGGQ